MTRRLALFPALATLILAVPALAEEIDGASKTHEDADQEAEQDTARSDTGATAEAKPRSGPPSVSRKLTGGWIHVGGGGGGVNTGEGGASYEAGRFVAGGGGYTWFLYGGSELSITGHQATPFSMDAAGFLGVAVPVPVVHPLLGVRGAIGGHVTNTHELAPQLSIGPQVGFVLRPFDGKPGLRLMLDGGVQYRPIEQETLGEFFVTVSAVF